MFCSHLNGVRHRLHEVVGLDVKVQRQLMLPSSVGHAGRR